MQSLGSFGPETSGFDVYDSVTSKVNLFGGKVTMRQVKIKDTQALQIILEHFSHLDDIRWSQSGNYNLINYYKRGLTADEKLLTHWLCYIVDRQMPFMRIWDLGGYVLSSLVHDFQTKRAKDVRSILEEHINDRDKEGKLRFSLIAPSKGKNKRLQKYESYNQDGVVSFASRYIPEDLLLIYRTFLLLDKISKRSFIGYFIKAIEGIDPKADDYHYKSILRMADSLDKLTYVSGGAIRAQNLRRKMKKIESEAATFTVDFKEAQGLYTRKRLWCSLRDFLKSPEFNREFVKALREEAYPHSRLWNRSNQHLKRSLHALELPGDVWNNSEVFRKGLFDPYIEGVPRTWDMPKTVRGIFHSLDREDKLDFHPEQLDVTFDFVPRMCERNMCDVCLFGKGILLTCHKKKGTLCSVTLLACGYKHPCLPSECYFKDDKGKELCKSMG